MNIGYIGSGRMGFNIAKNINYKFKTFIWNRTEYTAIKHSNLYNTNNVSLETLAKKSDIILCCLPTVCEVENIIDKIYPYLKENQIIIDNSTSDPYIIREINKKLLEKKIYLFDSPVSGGPDKANDGTLSCMIGGNKNIYHKIEPVLNTFSSPTYVGQSGNGCIIKVINNILNITNLLVLTEGLNVFKENNIDIDLALKIINKSSGRSLMSEERFPKHIIKGNYNYGFSLKLMEKDVKIALNLINNPIILNNTMKIINKYNEKNQISDIMDYTEITKFYFDINNE